VTARPMAGPVLQEEGLQALARRHGQVAAGMERAAEGKLKRVRHGPADRLQALRLLIRLRNRSKETLGIWMERVREQFSHLGPLHDPPRVHDGTTSHSSATTPRSWVIRMTEVPVPDGYLDELQDLRLE